MRSTLFLLCSLGLAACSHGSVENGFNGYTGAVNGVILLPDSEASDASACTQLSVYATVTDSQGQPQRVGRASVHQGNGRCSYNIGELPPAVSITVHVEPAGGMKCGNGASLAFRTESQTNVSVEDHGLVTRDFQPQCSATTSSL